MLWWNFKYILLKDTRLKNGAGILNTKNERDLGQKTTNVWKLDRVTLTNGNLNSCRRERTLLQIDHPSRIINARIWT